MAENGNLANGNLANGTVSKHGHQQPRLANRTRKPSKAVTAWLFSTITRYIMPA